MGFKLIHCLYLFSGTAVVVKGIVCTFPFIHLPLMAFIQLLQIPAVTLKLITATGIMVKAIPSPGDATGVTL